jgi:hypothetical protein
MLFSWGHQKEKTEKSIPSADADDITRSSQEALGNVPAKDPVGTGEDNTCHGAA